MRRLLLASFVALIALAGRGKAHDTESNDGGKSSTGTASASTGRPRSQHHAWTGVWQGTIGTAPVRVCFGTEGDPDQGSYYYLRHLSLISLDAPYGANAIPASEGWTERGVSDRIKPAPRWTLSPGPDGALNGTWSGGGRTAPIRLTRVAGLNRSEADAPCGGITFQRPRIIRPVIVRKPATLGGTAYQKIVAEVGSHFDTTIETFRLLGSSPAVARVNADAADVLPKTSDATVPDYLECAMGQAGSAGENGEFLHTLKPGLITRRWLAADEITSGTCGGAHPWAEESWRIWSLAKGGKVDAWSWFSSDAVRSPRPGHPEDGLEIEPRLRRLLVAHWSRGDGDCADIGKSQDDWTLHPKRDGLAFWPGLPHVVFACSEDDVIPYHELQPLLNVSGRAAVASIVEDLQSLPPRSKAGN